jgi:ribosomal protein S18 acetylase RimI-like enzyme
MNRGRRPSGAAAVAGSTLIPSAYHGHVTNALMLTKADGVRLDAVAGLVAAAVGRREALGLAGPLTAADYRGQLDGLLTAAGAGDAGLAAVLGADGAVLGTAQWTRSAYRTRPVLAELDRVCVAPEARGLGVGRLLVEAATADARAHGIEVLGLEVRGNNHGAIALYEHCGFRRTGLIPNAVAEDADRYDIVLMHRELPRPAGVRLVGSLPEGIGASMAR